MPFAYESTGAVTQFTNALGPDPRNREIFVFLISARPIPAPWLVPRVDSF